MTVTVRPSHRRRKIVFTNRLAVRMAETQDNDPTASAKLEELLSSNARIEELSSASEVEIEVEEEEEEEEDDSDSEPELIDGQNVHGWLGLKVPKPVPSIFLGLPLLRDELVTETTEVQDAVAQLCIDLMSGKEQEMEELNKHGIPKLRRQKHVKFLRQVLGKYPHQFQVMDASRPWLLYWGLAGLSALGEDVSKYRERTIQTFAPMQNPNGGFGGGYGQLSHCAASYAATLSLAIVDGLHIINRKTMWQWLGSVKQADGGFAMAIGGEEDVRGAYCSMTIASLLNLPIILPSNSPANVTGTETFLTGLGEWFGRCQTYEGGIGGAPDNEAHGAYAFCCLAGLSIIDAPFRSIPKYLNVNRLLSWLSSRQTAPEGGLSGRSNKLVDACYSHWVGGCWSLIEAALGGPTKGPSIGGLFNREALVRYTLCCSQTKAGGLRDKPGTRQDGYHTCYSLAGLSAAQYHWNYQEHKDSSGLNKTLQLEAPFNWSHRAASEEERNQWAFDESDALSAIHPVFVIPPQAAERARKQFQHTVGF